MDPSKLRKRQIARRLGVSEQVLEQYLQLKRAEVLQPKSAGSETLAPEAIPTATLRPRASSDLAADATPPGPSRGSRQHRSVSAGQGRFRRGN